MNTAHEAWLPVAAAGLWPACLCVRACALVMRWLCGCALARAHSRWRPATFNICHLQIHTASSRPPLVLILSAFLIATPLS